MNHMPRNIEEEEDECPFIEVRRRKNQSRLMKKIDDPGSYYDEHRETIFGVQRRPKAKVGGDGKDKKNTDNSDSSKRFTNASLEFIQNATSILNVNDTKQKGSVSTFDAAMEMKRKKGKKKKKEDQIERKMIRNTSNSNIEDGNKAINDMKREKTENACHANLFLSQSAEVIGIHNNNNILEKGAYSDMNAPNSQFLEFDIQANKCDKSTNSQNRSKEKIKVAKHNIGNDFKKTRKNNPTKSNKNEETIENIKSEPSQTKSNLDLKMNEVKRELEISNKKLKSASICNKLLSGIIFALIFTLLFLLMILGEKYCM